MTTPTYVHPIDVTTEGFERLADYPTLGQYDVLVVSSFADYMSAARFALAIAGEGDSRSETMRAFDTDEFVDIGRVPGRHPRRGDRSSETPMALPGAPATVQTTHEVVVGDARDLHTLDEGSVELVVTSPPYPMIELWDETFAELDPAVADALEDGDGDAAFERMHACLDAVWAEVERVLVDGGIACVNVGDATRTVDGTFRLFENHVRVSEAFGELGFLALPPVRWRKPTNRGTKFMGSGMLPPNAYVTLEHEHVLVFRKGDARSLPAGDEARYESAYFWEERNDWFSDLWADVSGEAQALEGETRARSGAFPLEVPYRLVHMYSVRGETVLDPFAGTGTTTLAALAGARHSVAYELDGGLAAAIGDRIERAPAVSRRRAEARLADHRRFVEERLAAGRELAYDATHYEFPVMTAQEQGLRLYEVTAVAGDDGRYTATHAPVEGGGA